MQEHATVYCKAGAAAYCVDAVWTGTAVAAAALSKAQQLLLFCFLPLQFPVAVWSPCTQRVSFCVWCLAAAVWPELHLVPQKAHHPLRCWAASEQCACIPASCLVVPSGSVCAPLMYGIMRGWKYLRCSANAVWCCWLMDLKCLHQPSCGCHSATHLCHTVCRTTPVTEPQLAASVSAAGGRGKVS